MTERGVQKVPIERGRKQKVGVDPEKVCGGGVINIPRNLMKMHAN